MPRALSAIDAHGDNGVVVEWLIKVVVLIAITGALLAETAGVLLARYNASAGASAAASQAAFGLRSGAAGEGLEDLARGGALQHGSRLISMGIDPQAQTVSVTVENKARTFFVHKFRALQGLAIARASDDASYESG